MQVDNLQQTSINVAAVDETERDDDFQEVVLRKPEVDRDEVSRKDLEKQLIEIRKELLLLKKEKLKEEQRRLVSEAGVPKVHDFVLVRTIYPSLNFFQIVSASFVATSKY